MGSDTEPSLVRYRYEGAFLAEAISANERTRFLRDGFGQVVQEQRSVARVDDTPSASGNLHKVAATSAPVANLSFLTRYRYDDAGRMVQQTMPDGHRVAYVYGKDKHGHLSAILFDEQPLVSGIVQSVGGGLTGYTSSNGMREQVQLDSQGRVAQLTVRAPAPEGVWEQIRRWFGAAAPAPKVLVYSQDNKYDKAGRLVTIARSQGTDAREERFDYDAQNRLTGLDATDGARIKLAYDASGNRRNETVAPAPAVQQPAFTREYAYAPASNQLAGIGTFVKTGKDAAQSAMASRSAWIYHPTGVPLAQLNFVRTGGMDTDASRRIVYNTAKRPVAVYDGHQLVARYHYNDRGERIAKTVYARAAVTGLSATGAGSVEPRTTYSLYMGQRLAAEADGNGPITAHYIYLYGKPVAKIEMDVLGKAQRSLWQGIVTLGGLIGTDIAVTGQGKVYAIHTDHLGTPQMVTDAQRQIVWQGRTSPFGATVVRTALKTGGKVFEINLRLPGQVFDSETGLNQNYYRDYDPQLGRYLTPDPSGLEGAINPYTYVSNNPLTNVDPLGLYEEDVHYYMTYFLARAAGVDARMAYIIATGAQYIDNNPATYPLAPSYFTAAWDIMTNNAAAQNRLRSYHFTQTADDDKTEDMATRYKNPSNPQLTRLLKASTNAGEEGTECSKAVLFGEYLHAYEDTFAHRRYDNRPVGINKALGHAGYGHMPDHTYNETKVFGHDWLENENRTLQMEHEVFDMLKTQWGTGVGPAVTWSDIEPLMKEFNGKKENSSNTDDFTGPSKKVDLLNEKLKAWSLEFVGIDGKSTPLNLTVAGKGQYKVEKGAENRENFLRYETATTGHEKGEAFKKIDPNFSGVILP